MGRVSLLLDMYKKDYQQNILHEITSCVSTQNSRLGTCDACAQTGIQRLDTRSTAWTTSYQRSLKSFDCRRFKIW
jgi:hypothetical protein